MEKLWKKSLADIFLQKILYEMRSGPGVIVKTLDYNAEDVGSNPTPDMRTECGFFLRKESKAIGNKNKKKTK